jgi:hypothetical protein
LLKQKTRLVAGSKRRKARQLTNGVMMAFLVFGLHHLEF